MLLKGFYILCFLIFLGLATSQYWNIGIMPADKYSPDCSKPPEDNLKPFLLSCGFSREKQCFFNASVPFLYWFECKTDHDLFIVAADKCVDEFKEYGKCNTKKDFNFTDPGDIIYRPLYEPDTKVRLYPEIFEAIQNLNQSYVKTYVGLLRRTFTSDWYSLQYNYKWLEKAEEEENE